MSIVRDAKYIDGAATTSDISGRWIPCDTLDLLSFACQWTGSPTGPIQIWQTNKRTEAEIENAGGTAVAAADMRPLTLPTAGVHIEAGATLSGTDLTLATAGDALVNLENPTGHLRLFYDSEGDGTALFVQVSGRG